MNIVIANTTIRTDAEGRYCLNDLHKAAGELSKDQPSKWLILESTKELIREIEAATQNLVAEGNQAVRKYLGGNGQQGTFVCKELVYAYAMWISPAFHLKVIRAYDALVSNMQVAVASSKFYNQIPQTLPEALRLAAGEIEKNAILSAQNAALEEKIAEAAPKIRALELISAGEESMTLTQAAKVLGMKLVQLTSHMNATSWIYRQNGSWIAYDRHIKNGNLRYKEARYTDSKTGLECIKPYCHVTPKGLVKLAQMFGVQLSGNDEEGEAA